MPIRTYLAMGKKTKRLQTSKSSCLPSLSTVAIVYSPVTLFNWAETRAENCWVSMWEPNYKICNLFFEEKYLNSFVRLSLTFCYGQQDSGKGRNWIIMLIFSIPETISLFILPIRANRFMRKENHSVILTLTVIIPSLHYCIFCCSLSS